MAPRSRPRRSIGVASVRIWLPALLVLAAVVVLVVGPRGLAPGLVMAALFVVVADWIIRFAFSSQLDRDREASARARFARSGRWPEDERDGPAPDARDAPPDATPPARDHARAGHGRGDRRTARRPRR